MIIVVSDVHLGCEKSNLNDFNDFLDKCMDIDIDDFVLLGDILDFWRCNNVSIIKNCSNEKILDKIANLKSKHIHYVVGNHDYYMLKLYERYGKNFPFTISKNLRLEDNGNKFYFIHGYELEVLPNLEPLTIEDYERFSEQMCFNNDFIGGLADKLWDLLNNHHLPWNPDMLIKPPVDRAKIEKIYDFAISNGKYILLGMKPEEILVYGHTHRPFINYEKKVVNTGSWVNELSKEKSQNRYVKISDGRVELRAFGIDEFP